MWKSLGKLASLGLALLTRLWPSKTTPEEPTDGAAARQGTSAGEAQRRASKGPFKLNSK
jgi:hypothetical protein